MKHTESKIQQECVRWFRMQYPKLLIYAIPNGGKRGITTASIMKAEGVLAGCGDLHIPIARGQYHSLYIEMKSATGRQKPSQKEFQAKVESFGNAYRICRSFDEFQAVVNWYLKDIEEIMNFDVSLSLTESEQEYEPYFGWCDVDGCKNEGANGGGCWRETGYWTVCSKHSSKYRAGEPQPPMKKMAIDREKRRGADGVLVNEG